MEIIFSACAFASTSFDKRWLASTVPSQYSYSRIAFSIILAASTYGFATLSSRSAIFKVDVSVEITRQITACGEELAISFPTVDNVGSRIK